MYPVQSTSYQPRSQRPWVRCVARCLLLLSLGQNLLLVWPAHAQAQTPPPLPLTPHRGAPAGQRPLIDAARNGVPIVMIAPASAAGVSRNQFEQFNVNPNGLILGNNSTAVQTQLGGWIAPNLQLGVTPARIILNEVLASDPSRLKGTIEVAGRRADIVIANPNGIECDGCGFLNTAGRTTLTTGRPQFGKDGALQGFDVQQGQLSIGAAGLSAGNLEQLDLLARGLVIEGEIWAANLQILAGVNQVLYANLQALPGAAGASAEAPRFAIDIKDLGGMFANQIRVIATEQGLGVNSTGRMAALQGNLQLSVNGDLTLKDSYAQGSMALRGAGDLSLTGQTLSQGALHIEAGAALRQAGELEALGQLSLNAGSFNNSHSISARSSDELALQVAGAASNSGVIFSGGNLRLKADRFGDRGGKLSANGELLLGAQTIDLANSTMEAGGNVSLQALGGRFDSRNTRISAAGNLGIDAVDVLAKQGGQWLAGGAISVQGSSVSNVAGSVQAGGALSINSRGAIDNSGGKLLAAQMALNGAGLVNDGGVIASDNAIQIITSGALSNRGGTLHAANGMDISSQGSLNNAAGAIWSGRALALAVGDLNNEGGKIVAQERANIDSGRTSNIGGLIVADGALGMRTGSLDNSRAEISSGGALTIDTQGQTLVNTTGRLLANGDIDVRTGAFSSNAGALIASAKNIQVQADRLNNDGSRISAVADAGAVRIALGSGDFSNNDGGISGAALVQVNAGDFSNQRGQIISDKAVRVSAASVDNSGGTISALQALDINSQAAVNNRAGRLLSDVDVTINATAAANSTALDNTDGVVSAAHARLTLGSASLVNSGGQLVGAQTLTLASGAIVNRSGRILTDGALAVDTLGQTLDNTAGVIRSAGTLQLTGGALDNAAGLLSSGTAININSQALDNADGEISTSPQSAGAISIDTHGQALRNDAGKIVAQGNLSLLAGAISNRAVNGTAAYLMAAGASQIAGASVDNSGSIVGAGQDLSIIAAGDVRNADGDIRTTGNLVLRSASLDNSAGRIVADHSAGIASGTLRNDAGGSITAIGALTISAGASNNQDGVLSSNSSVRLNLGALDNRGGEVSSAGELRLESAGQALDNTGGVILAQGAMTLRTGALTNDTGRIVGGAMLTIDSEKISNRDAFIGANGKVQINSSALLDNDRGAIHSGSDLALNAGALNNIGGRISAVGSAHVDAGNSALLDNRGGTIVAANLDVQSSGLRNNDGGLIGASGALAINTRGQALDNDQGRLQGDVSLDVRAGATSNIGGHMVGGQQLSLNSGALDNTAGEIISAGALSINTAAASLRNTAGRIVGGSALIIDAGALRNDAAGVIGSIQDVTLALASLNNDGGAIQANRDLQLDVSSAASNFGGSIAAQRELRATVVGALRNSGAIQASGQAILNFGDLDNDAGQLLAGGGLNLQAGRVSNRAGGIIGAGNDMRIYSSSVDNAGGQVQAGRDLQFTGSNALTNKDGRILAGGKANLVSGSLSNDDGVLAANLGVTISSGAASNVRGQIVAGADADLNVDSFDNRGGRLVADGNVKLTSGALTNEAQGLIGAHKTLNIQAGVTSNQSGVMTAGDGMTLSSAALNNRGGEISSATTLKIDTNGRQFDNAGGRVLAPGALYINTAELINTSGQLASDTAIQIDAASIANGTGTILSEGDLRLRAASLDNSRGTLAAAQVLDFALSGTVRNSAGLIQAGQAVIAAGAVSNDAGGVIRSNNSLTVDTAGQAFNNTDGVVQAVGALTLRTGATNNARGEIASAADLLVNNTGAFDNSAGQLTAKGALTVALHGQDLLNSGGKIAGVTGVDIQAASLRNAGGVVGTEQNLHLRLGRLANDDGVIQAGLDLTIASSSDIDSNGGRISAGRDAILSAAKIANLANGTQGSLTAVRDMKLTAGGDLRNSGTLQSGRDATLRLGALLNDQGSLLSKGAMQITANGVVNNTDGAIGAEGALAIAASGLDNTRGRVLGNGDVTLGLGLGALRNDGGLIGAGGALRLVAGSINNRSPDCTNCPLSRIIGTTGLNISSGALDNSGGLIASKGDLVIDTHRQDLINSQGLIQAEGNLDVTAGRVVNHAALAGTSVIAAKQVLFVDAAHIDNSAGTLSGGTGLALTSKGALINNGGAIVAEASASVRAASLSNRDQGKISAADGLAVEVGNGAIDNTAGTIISGELLINSGAIDNTRGVIAATQGALSINTLGGKLTNDSGRIQAKQNLSLQSGLSSNRSGLISAQDLSFKSAAFDNSAGQVIAARNLGGNTRALNNSTGLLQSGANLTLDTNGQLLVNSDSGASGGILSGGVLEIVAGSLDNHGGVIGSSDTNRITIRGAIDNSRGGLITSGADSSVSALSINNSGGRIEAVRDLKLVSASLLDNRAGSLVAKGDIGLSAATIDNSANGLIDANNVNAVSGLFNNAGGTLRAANNATIKVTELDNTGGSVSAGGVAQVTTSTLYNDNGLLRAGKDLQVSTNSYVPGGVMESQENLTLEVSGYYSNSTTVSAQKNLSIRAANIDNTGTLKAGDTFSADTGDLFNSGAIVARNNRITARGTLINIGVIDASDNRITAAALDNIGRGRIYGGNGDGSGQLQVNAAHIANSAGASIMSRSVMNLAGQTLYNSGSSLIYGLGNINIDALQSLTNDAAKIEASGNLTLRSAHIFNLNAGLTTREVKQAPVDKVLVQPKNMSKQYSIELCSGIGGGQDENSCIEHPDKYGQRSVLLPIHSGGEEVCNGDDGNCHTNPITTNYAWNAPEFAQFGVVPVATAAPAEPGGVGSCSNTIMTGGENAIPVTVEVNSTPCNQWRASYATWDGDFNDRLTALGSKIDAYNVEVNEDNRVVGFQDYTVLRVTATTTKTEVVSSTPAQIFAGGDLTLIGETSNVDSQIVTGGTVKIIAGPPVLNLASQGKQQTTYQGTQQTSTVEADGMLGGHERKTQAPVPYNPAPTIDPRFDLLEVRVISGQNRSTNQAPPAGSAVNVSSISGSAASVTGKSQGVINTNIGSTLDTATRVIQDRASSTAIAQPEAPKQVAPLSPAASAPVVAQTDAAAGVVNAQTPIANGPSTGNTTDRIGVGQPAPAAIAIAVMQGPQYVGQTSPPPASASATPAVAVLAPNAQSAARVPFTVQSVAAPGDTLVRSAMTRLFAPTASVFRIHSEPGARYLVETDPQFTQKKSFISSDYFLQQLQLDPERQLKRYGDGFYEQQQVNDQILALTGRRFITGYSSTENEFKALMDAGVAYGRQFQLTPGVSLSAEQMALLTTDIVWLTEQTVTLANGQTEQVLVPQVYLRRARDSDLQQSGALISGTDVFISSEQGIVNSGAIQAERSTTLLSGQDLLNAGGRIRGQDVLLRANNDFQNLSGTIQGRGSDSTIDLWAGRDLILQTVVTDSINTDASSTRSNIGRIATVQGGAVLLGAARDLNVFGGAISAQSDMTALAGRDLKVSPVEGRYEISVVDKSGPSVQGRNGFINDSSVTNTVATINAGKDLSLGAANLLTLKGANLDAANDLLLQAGKIDISAVRDSVATDIQTIGKKDYNRIAASDETLVGGKVEAGHDLTIEAFGTNELKGDIDVKGAYLSSKDGALSLSAQSDINITALTTAHTKLAEQYSKSGNLFSSKTTTTSSSSSLERVEGSLVSGNSVTVRADTGDVRVNASNLVGDALVKIDAGRNITLDSAAQTSAQQNSREEKTSGLFSNGGASITLGKREIAQQRGEQATEQIGSSVASLGGDIRLHAGQQYTQTASQVNAVAGDIDINARDVLINVAHNRGKSNEHTETSKVGLGGSVSAPLVSAIQSVASMSKSAGNTSDPRMQALAAYKAAMSAKDAAASAKLMAGGGAKALTGVKVSVSLGSSKSEKNVQQTSSMAVGSTVDAGGNLSIRASGTNGDGNLSVIGSKLHAGSDLHLDAANDLILKSAQSTTSQQSDNKSSGASIGIGFAFGGEQTGFTLEAAAYRARGNSDGTDTTQRNTEVTAGNKVRFTSGGDTTLKGAVVAGKQVAGDVQGNLTIESQQDTATYAARQQSAGIGASLCIPPFCAGASTVSASVANARADGDYASVVTQSGITAGDGGFQLKVKGNTELTGGVIASTVDKEQNSLTTAALVTSDTQNKADANAKSSGLTLSSEMLTQGKYGVGKGVVGNLINNGSESGAASGVTKSAISTGTITFTDEAKQQALSGKTGSEAIAALNRETAKAHTAATKQDVQAMEEAAEAAQVIKQATFKEATKFTDEAYRAMFVEKLEVYELVRDKYGKQLFDDKGIPIKRALSTEEKLNLQKGSDGKVHIANNGIFNDAAAAAKYANQHSTSEGPQYLIHFPEANNAISELMIAGYQNYLEGDTLGLTNASKETKRAMQQYGQAGLHLDGHSRGSMTIGNTMESLQKQGNAQGSLKGTTISFYGPAYNGNQADGILSTLQNRRNTDPAKQPSMALQLQNHIADPVGGLIGGNPGTGGTIPGDSSWLKEVIHVIGGQNTVHNCYGAGEPECQKYWKNFPNSQPQFKATDTYKSKQE